MKTLRVAAVVAVATAVMSTSPALAATAGSQSLIAVIRGGPQGEVITGVAHGLINAPFDDVPLESAPDDPQNLNRDRLDFTGGSLMLLTYHEQYPVGPVDPTTCIASFQARGSYEIPSGTGAYAGASGAGTFTGRGTIVFKRTEHGCADDEEHARFVILYRLTGTLSLPTSAAA